MDANVYHSYRDCSKLSLESSLFDKAVNYAEKEQDVKRYCIGTETAHLKEGLKGAEVWLEHVLSEREKAQAKSKADEKAPKDDMGREAAPKPGKGGKGKKKERMNRG